MDRTADLLRRLEGHRPADAAERRHRRALERLLRSAGDPFDRGRFEPGHVTASGHVLSPDLDRVLLIHHRALDRWLQPGGHVEPDDADVECAARREIREETGLSDVRPAGDPDAPFDVDVHPIPGRGRQPPHLHFDVRFLYVAGTIALRRGDEVRDTAWVALERLAERAPGASFARIAAKIAG